MIRENIKAILSDLPKGVELLAAVKGRGLAEIEEAIDSGLKIAGENYIQETEKVYPAIGKKIRWHMIGHLQKNKVKKAVRIFDLIETVDSVELAREIDKRSGDIGKVMPVLIEVNSAGEESKTGIIPEEVLELVMISGTLTNIRVEGVMTMGPYTDDPEDSRPYFKTARCIFDDIKKKDIPNVEMKYLSMGMSHSYRVAVEEGANIVRIGTKIFGERK